MIRNPQFIPGVQFTVGHDLRQMDRPILFILRSPIGRDKDIVTNWTTKSAEEMIAYLQKHIELARRKGAA